MHHFGILYMYNDPPGFKILTHSSNHCLLQFIYSLIVKSSLLPFAYSFFKLNGGSAKIKSAVSL